MLSIIRTTTLTALRADSAELETTRSELADAKAYLELATDAAIRADVVAERQLRDLAQAHADLIQAARDLDAAHRERDQARDDARRNAQAQLVEIRAEVEQLRKDATDPLTGDGFRGMLAYRILQRLYDEAREQGLQAKPPFDLAAVVLGFTGDSQPITSA